MAGTTIITKQTNGNILVVDSGIEISYTSEKELIKKDGEVHLLNETGSLLDIFKVSQILQVVREDATVVPINDVDTLFSELNTFFFFKLIKLDFHEFPVQDLIELRALPETSLKDKTEVYVEDELVPYYYDAQESSATAPNEPPDDQTGGTGFWIRLSGIIPAVHALGGAQHSTSTLAELNTKVSDAILDDASAPRDPNVHSHIGADVVLARITGSTFSTAQHLQDTFHSAGWISGGGITDDADGTITVVAGTGVIRATDSPLVQILFTDWAAESGANVNLVDNDINYVYVEYNAGSPRVIATITERTDVNTNILLAIIQREGTTLHINETDKHAVGDHANAMVRRLKATLPYGHAGGAILSETGTRNIAVTAGTFWRGLTEFSTSAIDTSAADTFSAYQNNGSWQKITAQTQINNTQFNNFGTGLAALSNNKYGVHWVYQEADDDDVAIVYGIGDYTLQEAENAVLPTAVPEHLIVEGILIGKIIIKKNDSAFTQLESAFTTTFTGSVATDHFNLVNIGTNTHVQIDSHIANTVIHKEGTVLLVKKLRTTDGQTTTESAWASAPVIAGLTHTWTPANGNWVRITSHVPVDGDDFDDTAIATSIFVNEDRETDSESPDYGFNSTQFPGNCSSQTLFQADGSEITVSTRFVELSGFTGRCIGLQGNMIIEEIQV